MRVNGRKVTMAYLAVLAATLLLASLSLGAAQSTNWTLAVTAASGSYTSTCTFGVNSGASSVSSGFDQTYDQVVPPPPPTGVYPSANLRPRPRLHICRSSWPCADIGQECRRSHPW